MALSIKELQEMRNAWEGVLQLNCDGQDIRRNPEARGLYREITPLLRKMEHLMQDLADLEVEGSTSPLELREALLMECSERELDKEGKALLREIEACIKKLERINKDWYSIIKHNKSLF